MKIYLAFVIIDDYTERVAYVSTDKNLLEEIFQPNDDDRWIMEVDLTDKKIVDVWQKKRIKSFSFLLHYLDV